MLKKIAIVGLGSIGRRHLRLLKDLNPEINIILVRSGYGPHYPEEKLAQCIVKNAKEAIKAGSEAAFICSPATFHIEQAYEWVEADKPLLIEKPLSNNSDGLEKFIEVVTKKKLPVLVGYVLRYNKAARYFQKQILDENYGTLHSVRIEHGSYLPDWRPEQDYRKSVSSLKSLGGGVLLEMSHELDYANWLFGPFNNVKASLRWSKCLEIDVEDFAEILLKNESGKIFSIYLDFHKKPTKRICRVNTDMGELIWDVVNNKVIWIDNSSNITEKIFEQKKDDMYREQILHFYECISRNTTPRVSLNDGVNVMKLIDAAKVSNMSQV